MFHFTLHIRSAGAAGERHSGEYQGVGFALHIGVFPSAPLQPFDKARL